MGEWATLEVANPEIYLQIRELVDDSLFCFIDSRTNSLIAAFDEDVNFKFVGETCNVPNLRNRLYKLHESLECLIEAGASHRFDPYSTACLVRALWHCKFTATGSAVM